MPAPARAIETAFIDAAAVVAAWGALLLGENVALGFLWRDQFSGAWEISLARHTIVPMAFAGFAPLSFAVVAAWSAARRAGAGERTAVRALAAIGALAAGSVGFGVSGGRHFASWGVRGPFVFAIAGLGALVGALLVPRVAACARRPVLLACFGASVAIGAWLADGYALPRLYPAFHWAMLGGSLLGAALVGIAFRGQSGSSPIARVMTLLVTAIVVLCGASTPRYARALERASNVRIALVEHAPLVGPVVMVAAWLHGLGTVDEDATRPAGAPRTAAGDAQATARGEVARALDWTGHDLLLLSVDALRADHVTSYGYSRSTTPHIDALSREGTLFEHAYCPTPHTSYSLTSMLTGKYMRPLLGFGLGEDSETWAQALRRYGWRTAAFYPPAVFFIDQDRFKTFEAEHLGFEYAKVEFADPALRERQVGAYLESAPQQTPLFLWVHLFEPHEPYVMHPDHVFGGASPDVDAYDSEVAEDDDAIGAIAGLFRAHRPGAVVIVTADHGEEFGEHGGRYHGTTVYEEQVRVPMVVSGPGVAAGRRVATVVQTIDLLPTALSALGMPRPARVRGRDLGALLATPAPASADPGLAFAETDDYALVASGDERLVCERRAVACALYRPADDPGERRDVAGEHPDRFDALRSMLRAVERDHGRYEASGPVWPEALRRGMQGEADAALDVASLLDDADVTIRRKAAEVCFRLQAPDTAAAVRRAFAHDEDDEVVRWAALALARLGEPIAPRVDALLADPDREWRRRAALTLGERGEGRACDEIAAWWQDVLPVEHGTVAHENADGEPLRLGLDLPRAVELLTATAKARCRAAVPSLVRALDDVRARPRVADALGAIGDERARRRLLDLFTVEPYVTARPHEARALLALGTCDWSAAVTPASFVQTTIPVDASRASAFRLLVLVSDGDADLDARAGGESLAATAPGADVRVFELGRPSVRRLRLDLHTSRGGVVAVWLVPADRLD